MFNNELHMLHCDMTIYQLLMKQIQDDLYFSVCLHMPLILAYISVLFKLVLHSKFNPLAITLLSLL